MKKVLLFCSAVWALSVPLPCKASDEPWTVGSKSFTESVVLGELLSHTLGAHGIEARHRRELGGTRILFSALERGEIDAYVEYTGTLRQEILAAEGPSSLDEIREVLGRRGIAVTEPLGFDNSYAIGMLREPAERSGLRNLSDLRSHPSLRFGFTNEFLDRGDGWGALRLHYDLPQTEVRGLDHDLAYRALVAGQIDAIDLYTTDAEIAYYDLAVLEDDRGFFPSYQAVILYLEARAAMAPASLDAFGALVGKIDEPAMIAMNAEVKLNGESESAVAASFLSRTLEVTAEPEQTGRGGRIWQRTREHAFLVFVSVLGGVITAVPLGVLAAKRPRAGRVILAVVGGIQTVPALALLVLMIPLLGIYEPPAIAALFLYSLLPIVRNTVAGLSGIPDAVRESAIALGLTDRARLFHVELPLALRSILAGVKISVVITIGFASLGALIGAGGYGQPILTGIRLDDFGLILEGAVPAALMALIAQAAFDWLERRALGYGR